MSLLQRMIFPLCQRMHPWRLYSNNFLERWKPSCCANIKEKFTTREQLIVLKHRLLSGTLFSRNLSSFSKNTMYILSWKDGNLRHPVSKDNFVHFKSTSTGRWGYRNKTVMMYVLAGAILIVGFSYASVPLYTIFCQATGLGGEVTVGHDADKVGTMSPVSGRQLVIRFNADTAASMRWNFKPQQAEIKVYPGETALAFYSAINPTDKPIIGISTYNVVPFDAGQYFNKIQCFCFEEQRLNPHEQVDMPVFFYIDPEFAEDPKMGKVDTITLSYTFFEAKEGLILPDPFAK